MAQNQRHSLAAQTQRPFDLATPSTADSYDARDEWNGDEPPSSSEEETVSDDESGDEAETLLNKPPNTPMLENGIGGPGSPNSRRQQQSQRQSEWHPTQWSKALKKNKEVKYLLYVLTGLVVLSGSIGIWAAGQYGVKNPAALSAGNGKQFITLDHLFNYTFWVDQKEVEWVKEAGDGIFSTLSPNNSIILVDLNSPSSGSSSSPGKESVLLNLEDVRHPKTGAILDFTNNKGSWRLSPDMKFVLVKVEVKKQWRYSSFATYYIYEIASKTTRALHPPPPTPQSRTRYATWSPTGHAIAYVHESDIYVIPDVKKLFAGNEERIKLTYTPEEESKGNGIVFNGVPGWVYEEEIFNSPHTLYFSPGSTKLAFLSFNESKVPEYSFPVYNPTDDNSKVVEYTTENKMRYPKPGFPNPVVNAWVFDLDGYLNDPHHSSRSDFIESRQDRPTIEYTNDTHISHGVNEHLYSLSWPDRFTPEESIIFETVWVSDNQLLVKESDRGAERGAVILFQADKLGSTTGGKVDGKVVRKLGKDGDEVNDGGWLETNKQGVHTIPSSLLTQLVAGSGSEHSPYLDIVPSPAGYDHIALFPSASSPTSEAYFLTVGEWEVVGTVRGIGQREDGIYIYFLAARPHPGERRVFSVKIPTLGDIATKTGEDRLRGEPIFELTPGASTGSSAFDEEITNDEAAAPEGESTRVLVGEEIKSISSPAYYTVHFSPFSGFYQLNYEGPGVPWQKVLKVGDSTANGDEDEFSYTLTNNSQLRQTLERFELPKVEWWSVPTEDGKSTVSIKTIYPPNFGGGFPSPGTPRNKQPSFPILFRLYNGPTSQLVDYRFTLHWDEYLASSPSHQYVVCIIDGRGTGFRGRPYRNVIKGRLGLWEETDQRAGARGVINSLNKDRRIIDDKRVGVWGWSYGGYLTSKLVETNSGDASHKHEGGPYNLAMAVAPVTDWRLYDTIYTERYLSTPQRNSLNYTLSSITNVTSFGYTSPTASSEQNDWVGRFGAAQTSGKGKSKSLSYLLAHGTGDDNVHFSNSAHLIDMLTGQGVRGWRFRMFVDSDHSIYKRNAQRELYEFLTSFLEEKWGRGGAPSRSRESLIARG